MSELTLASLFDGIGGFPLAAMRNGIVPMWASEIEDFPMKVTKARFPWMQHVGDISKLDGALLPPVDILTGGSPCQDLSTAGKRAGLDGERSGLFMEQVRITKEMRDADEQRGRTAESVRPRYMAWENVPGAFSSCGEGSQPGEDFRIVLEEICRIKNSGFSIPRPETGRWEHAGAILGEEFSLAWRVFDAQYWGVPQRRKRIYLVADFAGHSAPQILFEQDRLFGDSTPSEGAGQDAAAPAGESAANTGRTAAVTAFACNQRDEVRDLHDVAGAVCATQTIKQQTMVADVLCLNDQGGQRMDVSAGITGTLRAQMDSHQPLVLFEGHGKDARYSGPLASCPTISASYGTGGGNIPLAMDADSYCIAGNILDRQAHNGGNHMGFQEDVSYTLNTCDRHAVFSRQRVDVFMENDVAATQSARQYKDATDLVCDFESYQNTVGALYCSDKNGPNNQYVSDDKCVLEPPNLIRRLTPLECERLQGFPDFWTELPGCSDSARYKALGNSVAIPCVEFVLRGIAYFLRQQYAA